eukprot:TRINITY_DN3687_c0_g1_i1.p1 TRINITY_DN3687_c0_g1~~TRINITY_DN3687_c0_g1_i1.p1  ORF type:complete len:338 (-),score=19.83 TRINITY_DN3687_c0_g1_i1:310-1323(-)
MSNCSAYNGPVCFGKGDCLLNNLTGTWQCVWRSDELGYADSWLYVIFSVLLLLLALLYLLEILLDFSRYGFCKSQLSGGISLWKNPILFCKLFGFAACIFRATFFIMSAHEAVANYNFGRWQKTFMEVVALLAVALTYGFHSIVWISTILKAKSLGGTNKHIRRYRVVVYVVMLCAPVFFFLAMFNVFIPGDHEETREILSYGGISLQAIYLLTILTGNSVFVYQVLRWALKMFKGNTKNRAVKSAIRRTTALLVCNISFACLFGCEILDFFLDEKSKSIQYKFVRFPPLSIAVSSLMVVSTHVRRFVSNRDPCHLFFDFGELLFCRKVSFRLCQKH